MVPIENMKVTCTCINILPLVVVDELYCTEHTCTRTVYMNVHILINTLTVLNLEETVFCYVSCIYRILL